MKGTLRIAALTVVAMLLLAAGARAEEPPTRAEYVERVEPICQANTEANQRILKNVKTKARSKAPQKVKEAGAQFIRASSAFGAAVAKLAAVPRPAADDARLLKWFKYLGIVEVNLRKLGKALKAGEKILAAHEQIRVERSSNAANNVGFVFEFHSCYLRASNFT
jgi:Pyruvate/2-oxoacid:ferredoxin oxidoreductase gamma subunit